MKTILASLAFFAATSAFAKPTQQEIQIARLLINSPEAVAELKANNATLLTDVTGTVNSLGTQEWVLSFVPGCFCEPVNATLLVKVSGSSAADAPVKYESKVIIKPVE